MVELFKSRKGYFYTLKNNGNKKRISQKEYNKKKKTQQVRKKKKTQKVKKIIGGNTIPTAFFKNLLNEFEEIAGMTGIIITVEYDYLGNMVSFKFNEIDTFMFYIDDSTLRLTYVMKRSEIPTKIFIKKMIKVFNERDDFTMFTLGDTSKLKIQGTYVSLYKMKILETASTWYESMGFINGSLAEKREEVVDFIGQKLADVITDKTVLQKYQDEIDVDTILIKDFMSFIKDKLTSANVQDEIVDIKNVIDTLFDKLEKRIGKVNKEHYMKNISE